MDPSPFSSRQIPVSSLFSFLYFLLPATSKHMLSLCLVNVTSTELSGETITVCSLMLNGVLLVGRNHLIYPTSQA